MSTLISMVETSRGAHRAVARTYLPGVESKEPAVLERCKRGNED